MAATPKPEVTKSQSIRDYFKKNPTAHAKEVVTALAANGITVTESHVYVVKGKMKEKKLRKAKERKAAKAKPVASEPLTAKKSRASAAPVSTNMSQAVRDLLRANPSLSVDEVISSLADSGLTVKKNLVYMVKGRMKPKKRWKTKKKVATETVTTTAVASTSNNDGAGDALKTIKQIKGLAAELGGMKKLKALVEALAE